MYTGVVALRSTASATEPTSNLPMGPGECVTVPRGVEHRTCAEMEAEILCFEPAGVLNTGNVIDEKFTAPKGIAI